MLESCCVWLWETKGHLRTSFIVSVAIWEGRNEKHKDRWAETGAATLKNPPLICHCQGLSAGVHSGTRSNTNKQMKHREQCWDALRCIAGSVCCSSQCENQWGEWKGTNNHRKYGNELSTAVAVISLGLHSFMLKLDHSCTFKMNVVLMCPRMTPTITEVYNCTTVSRLMKAGYCLKFVILPDYNYN